MYVAVCCSALVIRQRVPLMCVAVCCSLSACVNRQQLHIICVAVCCSVLVKDNTCTSRGTFSRSAHVDNSCKSYVVQCHVVKRAWYPDHKALHPIKRAQHHTSVHMSTTATCHVWCSVLSVLQTLVNRQHLHIEGCIFLHVYFIASHLTKQLWRS